MRSSKGWLFALLGTATALGAIAIARTQLPGYGSGVRGKCYVFSYRDLSGLSDTLSLARVVRFPGRPWSTALTTAGFAGDTVGFWRMFAEDGKWVRLPPDSIQLQFTNGFSFVTYNLYAAGDSLVGDATVLFDFGPWDTLPRARALGRPCSSADRVAT